MIWITRPVADSEVFARQLALLGMPSLIAPVMRIKSCPFILPAKPDAIILTSRHAVHALPAEWRELPVYCVGAATAEAVGSMGYTHIVHGTRGAFELMDMISPEHKRILYLSGDEVSLDIPALLNTRGFVAERTVVYQAEAETSLDVKVIASFRANAISAVAFFSPRSTEIAAELMAGEALLDHVPKADAYCLSLKVAEAAGQLPWRRIFTCPLPTSESMLELLSTR